MTAAPVKGSLREGGDGGVAGGEEEVRLSLHVKVSRWRFTCFIFGSPA